MRKRILSIKKNNKGISLVEILVTIAIIAIIATPLVNSFINAMRVNSEARTIQNGTAAAQNTAELFKTLSLETLIEDYNKDKADDDKVKPVDGKYTFKDMEVTGADGEKFLVTVELNPSAYRGGGSPKLQVNGVNLPVFSGLFGSDSVMLYRQYAGYDDKLAELFAREGESEGLTEEQINKRDKFSKETDVIINGSYNNTKGEYVYEFDIKVTYTHDGVTPRTESKSLKKVYKGNEIHSVYMITPIFDVYSKGIVTGNPGAYYSTDKINVTYNYTGDVTKKQNLYFYIAEQEMYNRTLGLESKRQLINPDNLTVNGKKYNDYITQDIEKDTVSLKLYTNIVDNKYSLTYGDYNTGDSLYQMDVTVKLEGKSKPVATFSTTK